MVLLEEGKAVATAWVSANNAVLNRGAFNDI